MIKKRQQTNQDLRNVRRDKRQAQIELTRVETQVKKEKEKCMYKPLSHGLFAIVICLKECEKVDFFHHAHSLSVLLFVIFLLAFNLKENLWYSSV